MDGTAPYTIAGLKPMSSGFLPSLGRAHMKNFLECLESRQKPVAEERVNQSTGALVIVSVATYREAMHIQVF